METPKPGKRHPIWMDDELWAEVQKTARVLSVSEGADVSANELVRRALRYALAHPEALETEE